MTVALALLSELPLISFQLLSRDLIHITMFWESMLVDESVCARTWFSVMLRDLNYVQESCEDGHPV